MCHFEEFDYSNQSFKLVHSIYGDQPVLTNENTGVFALQNSTNRRKMDLKKYSVTLDKLSGPFLEMTVQVLRKRRGVAVWGVAGGSETDPPHFTPCNGWE